MRCRLGEYYVGFVACESVTYLIHICMELNFYLLWNLLLFLSLTYSPRVYTWNLDFVTLAVSGDKFSKSNIYLGI